MSVWGPWTWLRTGHLVRLDPLDPLDHLDHSGFDHFDPLFLHDFLLFDLYLLSDPYHLAGLEWLPPEVGSVE